MDHVEQMNQRTDEDEHNGNENDDDDGEHGMERKPSALPNHSCCRATLEQTTTTNGNTVTNEEEEAVLFASMDAFLLEQNVYEKDVLRVASYQTVPQLLPALSDFDSQQQHHHNHNDDVITQQPQLHGFPMSMTQELLQPFQELQQQQQQHRSITSPTSTSNPKKRVNATVVLASNVLQSLLDENSTRPPPEKEEQQPQNSMTIQPRRNDLTNMKEQILLHLLSAIGTTIPTTTTSNHKKRGGGATMTVDGRIGSSDSNKIPSRTEIERGVPKHTNMAPNLGRTTRRIPMMKRKRLDRVAVAAATAASNQNNTLIDDDTNKNTTTTKATIQRIDELKALRLQRIQDRQQKYSTPAAGTATTTNMSVVVNDSSDDDEIELDCSRITNEKPNDTTAIDKSIMDQDSSTRRAIAATTSPINLSDDVEQTISCPLCQQDVSVNGGGQDDMDALLAVHMNQCQQQNSLYTTRSKRQRRTTQVASYNENEDDNDKDNDNLIAPRRNGRMYQKVNIAKVAPKVSQPLDDMDENDYDDRVDEWIVNGLRRMKDMKERDPNEIEPNEVEYDNHFYIPAWMNNHLFQYQRDGVEWMYHLHQQMTGGIMGDEMGLGKTVQVAAFLGAAVASRLVKSILIVTPATILQHWLSELAIWAPGLRRILIHTSGGSLDRFDRSISYPLLQSLSKWLRKSRSHRVNEPIDDDDWETMDAHSFCGTGYAIVTTYENLRRNSELYAAHDWSYIVLDEAQKIRNPDADVTLACKRIRTPHRLAMSGTPIQNDLRELWSLLDFVFPGRLGTLPTFEQEFAVPIKYGGYSNASPMQVQLAYRCAVMLRDMIEPFLLRRLKKDVKEVSRMPGKTEHVLFCRLSQRQRAMYEAYLQSDVVSRVFRGNHMLLAAVTVLRKIANHPDLVCDPSEAAVENFIRSRGNIMVDANNGDASDSDGDNGYVGDEQSLLERSGKLDVLAKILPIWKKQGHRVLIFCQWRKMLDIIERFVRLQGWKFGRLDGNTNIASRQRLVDSFNTDESYFGMLCTTRTGGVGLNLIGANRCILYDPDWNPSGDAQARERAWRFGQVKEVTIYRLITAGTIEEKIYQRQIFKTAMTNKVLQDAKQRRLFSQRDLKDLFSLSEDTGSIRSGGDGITATSIVTNGVGVVESADLEGTDNEDNEVALKKLMKSKGLAGIFDHHSVEPDHKRKSTTVREMEERATQVAKEAAQALQNSVAEQDPFTPTWTGSNETKPAGMFGSNRIVPLHGDGGGGAMSSGGTAALTGTGSFSSSSLLATIRQRNTEIESGGRSKTTGSVETQKYTKLLSTLKDYVKRHRPSTEDILKEFDDIPHTDVAIFRRLLKSIATMQKGRWYLTDNC